MSDERSDWQRHVGVGERQHVSKEHLRVPQVKPVLDERGQLAGRQIEHFNGRVDAHVQAPVVTTGIKSKEVGT